ncbi:glycerate kinase type-2 family protein [Novosphingobium jiangmenense]|uniref:DUF4147 domain-containing protein n=1 Tax=Novosphingobium jiangmenense TaxID=2791981 RepID=A0ABS0HLH5_9SPHN|nr:DUF4147 domain-containing protein [Novosphingobium jiangmenense]MBF9153098.1 DUF4147 domain-containing protein [Novosphingobium jiangmenense]
MALRDEMLEIFLAGVAAASAPAALAKVLPSQAPRGRTIVLGCGKAAAAMAEVAARHLPGEVTGCVVTRFGHGARGYTGGIEVIEASHPVPDAASLAAGRRIRELAETARPGDRVVFLISGGGSSLLVDPLPGLPLARKAMINEHLVKSGAPITQINFVRRHLSQVKGGRLSAAAAAAADDMHSFVISDVVGDDPAVVASGPSVASEFDPERALAILEETGWPVDVELATLMREACVTTSPTHPIHVIATAATALDAAVEHAMRSGWLVIRLGNDLQGEASAVGRAHAAIALDHLARAQRCLLVSGGELTVTVRNRQGRGGPNLEYLTGLMAALPDDAPIAALACDSDGIDGSEDNAGGWFGMGARAPAAACEAALTQNRTYDLFAGLGGLIVTGPTRTNVNDIRLIAVGAKA